MPDVCYRICPSHSLQRVACLRSSVIAFGMLWSTVAVAADDIDYARDVRPILASNCFACHGPDATHREADLRLDVRDDAGDVHGGAAVIKAGAPDESELIARITTDDPDQQHAAGRFRQSAETGAN